MEQAEQTLLELARAALRAARAFPPGPDRNELRQIALALKALARRNQCNREKLTGDEGPSGLDAQG